MNRFESRLHHIAGTKFYGPVIDVMGTFETVCIGLDVFCPGNWTASDAAKLTELIIIQRPNAAPLFHPSLDGTPL